MVFSWLFLHTALHAQQATKKDTVPFLNLEQCIAYALDNQPAVRQTAIGIDIAKKTNAINLSAWLPQVNLGATLMHYNELPTSFSVNPANPEGPLVKGHPGVSNTLIPQLSATETLFSPDVLNAAQSAHLYVEQAKQSNDSTKINLIATVSTAFYNLLLSMEQLHVLQEDTARLAKNMRDTYHQYVGGVVDKTDYMEATITLNNSRAQLKQVRENIRPQYAVLKQQMGYPSEKEFSVSFDTLQMSKQISTDTSSSLQFEKRIEFQLLQTSRKLQQQAVRYYENQYLPSVSAFYNYYYEYESESFSTLFPTAYPYSYLGASINIPLFTGMRRQESLQRIKMQGMQLDWSETNLRARIYAEYASALANYKTNLFDLALMKTNAAMARDVYGVVSLQYKQGVVAYLNVITAESNLISSEMNYINALFQVLLSKVEL
ncbi:MAG TPA: TolC family protein, partial [Bacteroidia bacterium]|nr:TolC family protein [Bacteroidia bacterium]